MGSGEAMTSDFSQFHCLHRLNNERGDMFIISLVSLSLTSPQWGAGRSFTICFQPVPLLYWHQPNQWGVGRPWLLFSACSIVILTPTTNGELQDHDFCFQPVPLLYWHQLNQWGAGRPWLLFSASSIVITPTNQWGADHGFCFQACSIVILTFVKDFEYHILTPTQPMGSGETMTSVFSLFHCYTDTDSTNERGDHDFCFQPFHCYTDTDSTNGEIWRPCLLFSACELIYLKIWGAGTRKLLMISRAL